MLQVALLLKFAHQQVVKKRFCSLFNSMFDKLKEVKHFNEITILKNLITKNYLKK